MNKMFTTALLLRCPNCGEAPLYAKGLEMHKTCPRCEVRFERWPGTFLGPPILGYGSAGTVTLLTAYILYRTDHFFPGAQYFLAGVAVLAALLPFRNLKAWWIWLLWRSGWVFRDGEKGSDGKADQGASPARRWEKEKETNV